jgi:hypothetical protein
MLSEYPQSLARSVRLGMRAGLVALVCHQSDVHNANSPLRMKVISSGGWGMSSIRALRGMFQGRLAADPKKAHPRISTTSGMPNAMVAHISSFAHGTSAWDLISL